MRLPCSCIKQGDFAAAQDYAQQNLTLARAADSQMDIAYGLLSLGIVAYEQGDITTAYSYGEQSLPPIPRHWLQ